MKFSAPQLLAAVALAVSTLAQAQLSPPYTGLYVFGDSLSDGGNNRIALGANGPNPTSGTFIPTFPYTPSNTYSNGATWVNSFAAGLGLSAYATPSLAGGGNFAFGGARTTGGSSAPPANCRSASGKSSTPTSSPCAMTTARSMALRSSRTFPGHA